MGREERRLTDLAAEEIRVISVGARRAGFGGAGRHRGGEGSGRDWERWKGGIIS